VLGHYRGHSGEAPWGWRTTVELRDANQLVITSYNITPQGEETTAVEIDYRRIEKSLESSSRKERRERK
jgi:Protein of unknown function (DUF1579)